MRNVPSRSTFMTCIKLAALLAGFCVEVIGADEPLYLYTGPVHRFLEPSSQQQHLDDLDQYGLADHVALAEAARLRMMDSNATETLRKTLGFEACVNADWIAGDGSIHVVKCIAVDDPEFLNAIAQDYVDRIGDGAVMTVSEGVTSVTGPSEKVRLENGIVETRSWIPAYLRYENGIIYHGESDVYVRRSLPRRDASRLRNLPSSKWFFEARPSLVPEAYRSKMLEQALRDLATLRQRRDTESLENYVRRIAPLKLWGYTLRTYMFETESLLIQQAELENEQVQFLVELTAEKDSGLATAIQELADRRVSRVSKSGFTSGAFAVRIPAEIAQSAARLFPSEFGSPEISTAVSKTIASRKIALDWQAQISDSQLFMAAIRTNCDVPRGLRVVFPLRGRWAPDQHPSLPITIRANEQQQLELTAGNEFNRDAKVNHLKVPSNVIAAAYFNLKDLAATKVNTTANSVFERLQLALIRGMVAYYFPHRHAPDDLQLSKTLAELRQKIQGGSREDWQLELQVSTQPKNRRLSISVTVGSELYGFWRVAHLYLRAEAQSAAGY